MVHCRHTFRPLRPVLLLSSPTSQALEYHSRNIQRIVLIGQRRRAAMYSIHHYREFFFLIRCRFVHLRMSVFSSAETKNNCRTVLQIPTLRYAWIKSLLPSRSYSTNESAMSSSMDDCPIWRQYIFFISFSVMVCRGLLPFSGKL